MSSENRRGTLTDDRGFTLVEMGIAGLLTSIAAAVFLAALVSAQSVVGGQVERSTNNDQVRLAVQHMDRQIRSGNLLYNPNGENPANFSVRVYSQSNAVYRCIQWRVADGMLQTRRWAPSHGITPTDVEGWSIVAENVVNRELSPPVPAFNLSVPTHAVGRTLNVSILVNTDLQRYPDRTVRIDESLTGRNTTRGFQQDACDPVPAS